MSRELLMVARMRDMVRGREVQSIRVAAGLTLAEVAAECGVHASTVHYWEKGRSIPRGEAAVRYARLLFALEEVTRR